MSIKDIAEKLNVSKSTVSLVINGKSEKGRISEALTKRILDYVEEIGYKPNSLARSLATGKTKTIGLIVENIGDSFFGPIALYIEEYLRKHGYHVLFSSTLGNEMLANTILDMMIDKKVDGIILAPTTGQKKKVQKLLDLNFPVVVFDRRIPSLATNYIGTDNYTASKKAVQHLFEMGNCSVAMITTDSQQIQMLDRLRGYQEIVRSRSSSEYVLHVPFSLSEEERKSMIYDFLSSNVFDALYFSTNYLCVSALKLLKSKTLTSKYKIVCFDDHEIFELNTPSITCVRQPIEKISEEIVSTLLKQIKNLSFPYRDTIIPSEIIFRESSK